MVAKLSHTNGWVNGVTHHLSPNHSYGMAVPSGVLGVIMHTMVGDLPGTDNEFMNGNAQVSAHFGIDQSGHVIQWVDLVGGDVAWAEMGGNYSWYSIEHADHGNPLNPLTPQQITASAQLVELMSRVGGFPLQEANTTSQQGYGVHYMGGLAWGGHSCPDVSPRRVRSLQRVAVLALAKEIRAGTPVVPPAPLFDGPAKVKDGFYRWRVDAYKKNLSSWAQARNTTAEAIIAHSLDPASPLAGDNRAHFTAYAKYNPAGNGQMPHGLIFYSVNP
jgi:hypothetical protein